MRGVERWRGRMRTGEQEGVTIDTYMIRNVQRGKEARCKPRRSRRILGRKGSL